MPDIKGRFGFFPTSVLTLSRLPNLYKFLQDDQRPERNKATVYHASFRASHFPPVVSWFCLEYWSRAGELVLDPFGNRANIGLVANLLGRRVILNDIVPRYCEMMVEAGKRRPNPGLSWKVLNQDAAELCGVPAQSVDLILTGPPYHNIEPYEKVPGQASTIRTYAKFLEWYGQVAGELFRVIKPGKAAILKVGNWRKKGRLVTFTRDTIEACEAAGFILHDELICVEPAPLGLGFSWDVKLRNRYVHKAHQTALVFMRPE